MYVLNFWCYFCFHVAAKTGKAEAKLSKKNPQYDAKKKKQSTTSPLNPSYSVCIRVAPDLAIDPGSRHHPVVLILQPF